MEVFVSRGTSYIGWITFFIILTWNTNILPVSANNGTYVSLQLCKDTVLYGALSWDLHSLCCDNIYGGDEACEFVCPCINGARACNFTAETCECRDGFKGSFCQTSCKIDKRYGRQCINRCQCGPDAFCDHVTGVCVCLKEEGCKRCKVGRWGRNCNFLCDCGRGFSCNDDTGQCVCRNETVCNQTSSSDDNCRCQNGGTCTKRGLCNCRDGWTGSDCGEKCLEGLYGPDCQLTCHCGQGGRCHPETGFCLCPDLSKRYKCPNRCPEGKFGPKCAYHCYCPIGLTCNPTSGNCECPGRSCLDFGFFTTSPVHSENPRSSDTKTGGGGKTPEHKMPSITEPPVDMTRPTAMFSGYLLWVVVGIVAFLLIVVILLLVLIACKRQKVNDMDASKRISRLDCNDYEDVDEMNICRRENTLPPNFELPPIPVKHKSPNGCLPPVPFVESPEEPMVPRRVKSLMATSRKRQKQPQLRNSFHAHSPSMFSSLSTISTRSTETLTPLPKSIQNLGVTNEMLANESAYEATIKSSLTESRWSSMPSVPAQDGNAGPRKPSMTDSEHQRMSLVVADCDEYEDYADPFAITDGSMTSLDTKERRDNLANEQKAFGQIQSNPLYNGHFTNQKGLQKQMSSPSLARYANQTDRKSPLGHDGSTASKGSHAANTKLKLSHSAVTAKSRPYHDSLRDNKRFSSPVLLRKDSDDEDDYADPSDSVPSPRARALSDMRRSLHGSNSTLPESEANPTYFTLEGSSNISSSSPNSSRPESAAFCAANDSDYDELEEEPIETCAAVQKTTRPVGQGYQRTDEANRIQPHRKTYSGNTNNEDPHYFVLDRSRNAHSERAPNNNIRKKTFRARATEDEGDYSHLERISFDKGDIVVSDLQNDDYALLRS